MALGVTEEHRQLASSVTRWLERELPVAAARVASPAAAREAHVGLAAQGMLGLHLGEEHGGSGYAALEAAVVTEQLGAGLFPGATVPTMAAALVLQRHASDALAKTVLPALAEGRLTAALALDTGGLVAAQDETGWRIDGTVEPVLAAVGADLLLLGARDDTGQRWFLLHAADVTIDELGTFDSTRPLGRVTVAAHVDDDRLLAQLTADEVADLALVLFAAEAAGIAGRCLDMAADHAKLREQFGRPIGQFQGVKHLCADMLVRVEQARAAAWDLARAADDDEQRPLAAAVAAAVSLEAAHRCALDAIQILGGIGFTFEHEAHLYLRRATTLRQLFGAPATWQARIAEQALGGRRRTLHLELTGPEVDAARDEVRGFLAGLDELEGEDTGRAVREAISAAGYVNPHWPRPWGRDASAIEQLIIDEEFDAAGVHRPNLFIGGWILPTIIGYGTEAQQEQFVEPTLNGDIIWCQLFSEPGAGSDLAAISMKAEKVEGGWELTGQKVWTSLAQRAHWGLAIARTNPSAPKHQGITTFLVDMQHSDGLEIRPLKEITGNELFNEVFFDRVFVPDELVVGAVDEGWKSARTTLANERVAMSKGSSMGSSVEGVVTAFPSSDFANDPLARARLGALVAEGQVLSLIGFRGTLAALSGVEPGAGSSVRKLVGGHHSRDCAEFALELLGPMGATTVDAATAATYMFLQTQCLTIAGGTTNVQKNVIAERMLGLPRDAD